MLSLLFKPLRQSVGVLVGHDANWQIAAGAALGAIVGLVPKGNLIAIGLLVVLFSIRVNRSAGLLFIGLFALISPVCDSFTHRLGTQLLNYQPMQPWYAWLYDQPLGPWIGFNNTVVIGSLLVGLYIFYPVYLLVNLASSRFREPVVAWLKRRRITRWILGADVASRFGAPVVGLPGSVGETA